MDKEEVDLDKFMDWLHKISALVCKEMGFKQIVGPASVKLPLPVDGVSLQLDSTDEQRRYAFTLGTAIAQDALGFLARLSQAMKDRGEDGDYRDFDGGEVEIAMALIDEEIASQKLLISVFRD
jgi:hypothetical protein